MKTANETVYLTSDLVDLVNLTLTRSIHTYYKDRKVELLSISYCGGTYIKAGFDSKRNTLRLSLLRGGKLLKSPLIALAFAANENEDVGEYIFSAGEDTCRKIIKSIRTALYLTPLSQPESSELQLRYCNRLKRGQRNAQMVGRYQSDLTVLKQQRDSISEKIVGIEKWILSAKQYDDKHGIAQAKTGKV